MNYTASTYKTAQVRPWHGCANNRGAGNSRRHRAHYEVTVMNLPIYIGHLCSLRGNAIYYANDSFNTMFPVE